MNLTNKLALIFPAVLGACCGSAFSMEGRYMDADTRRAINASLADQRFNRGQDLVLARALKESREHYEAEEQENAEIAQALKASLASLNDIEADSKFNASVSSSSLRIREKAPAVEDEMESILDLSRYEYCRGNGINYRDHLLQKELQKAILALGTVDAEVKGKAKQQGVLLYARSEGNAARLVAPDFRQEAETGMREQMSLLFIKSQSGHLFAVYNWEMDVAKNRLKKWGLMDQFKVNWLEQLEGKKVNFKLSGKTVEIAGLEIPLASIVR